MSAEITQLSPGGGETQASAVYARLLQDVISTAIAPGEKLRIRELGARYGVGLSPLREALNRATSRGLVQHSDLRGFFAAPVSAQNLAELTKARSLLAEVCLRESILNGDAAWEERIVVAYYRLSRIAVRVDNEFRFDPAMERAHRAFHASLIAACGSSWLLDIDDQLFDAADRYRLLARRNALGGTPERPDQHRALMEVVLDRHVPNAVALLQNHYRRTAEHCLKELAHWQAQA